MVNYLHIITTLESGGAQAVLYQYLRHSKVQRRYTKVFFLIRGQFYKSRIEELGVDVYPVCSIMFLRYLINSVNKRAGKTFVIGWMYHANLLSILFWILGNRAIVWSIHHGTICSDDSVSVKIAARLSRSLSFFLPVAIVYPSNSCFNAHINFGFCESKGRVVYNPVDLAFFRKNREQANTPSTRIGFIGRNHPNKGFSEFLCAAIEYSKLNPKIVFVVCGESTNSEEVLSRLRVECVDASFTMLGEVKNAKEFYSTVDIVTCLSKVESFGLAVIEAIVAGKKVICLKLPVFQELQLRGVSFIPDAHSDTIMNAWDVHIYKSVVVTPVNDLKRFDPSYYATQVDDILIEVTD